MSQEASCWICHRTVAEITAVLGGETDEEAKVRQEMEGVTRKRDSLVEGSSRWEGQVPAAFKEFDLAFILQNAEQFRSMQFLDELVETGRGALRDLDEISYKVRKGDSVSVGNVPADEYRELIASKLNEFEKRTNRMLKREEDTRNLDYQRLGYIHRLKGLKLVEGMRYLSEAGAFYYDMLLELLEKEKAKAAKNKPIWIVRVAAFKEYPREVPVCNVCEKLIRELQAPRNGKEAAKQANRTSAGVTQPP